LENWAAPVVVKPGAMETRYVARGTVLVISTWNFPNPLALKPLAAALAAGNTCVVKMSEIAPTIGKLLGDLITKYCDPKAVRVVQGAIPQATALLSEKFDLIFYTGNTTVGKIVMKAAAQHLTPCVLELGGKNPVVVAADANIPIAARKIVDGRFKNAGQFCVAPDHVLCDESVKAELVKEMKLAVEEFFTANPKECTSYSRIVNQRHTRRVQKMLQEDHGGSVVAGGEVDISARYVAPTLVLEPKKTSAMMTEEIFGPILPIVGVQSLPVAIEFINSRPRSLALYVFSGNKATTDFVIDKTHSGGACINDVIVHMLNEDLPFGGNGASGHGSYHGIYGFRAFSHEKAVMTMPPDSLPPPHLKGGRFPPFE
jgi:acyl-CoA reductase-like NAD-dependent aldehyde dehydrogenase